MRACIPFLLLAGSLLFALPAYAQVDSSSEDRVPLLTKQEPAPETPTPQGASPLAPVFLTLFLFVLVSPLAVHYFGDLSKEMHAAQKGLPKR